MACREFEFVKAKVQGKAASAFRITCSQCDQHEDFIQTDSRRLPHEAAARKFRNHGWVVGSSSRKDICPNCQRKDVSMGTGPVKKDGGLHAPVIAPLKAEPPREMGKDDRRLIFAEIDGVYLGPEDGYADGTTDESLAALLGVPRAWVTSVREEFFGPERGENAKIGAALDRLALIEGDVKAERKKIEGIKQVLQQESAAIARIEVEIDRAAKAIAATRAELTGARNG